MGVVVKSTDVPCADDTKPRRRPSLKDDSSPVKPARKTHAGASLSADMRCVAQRFQALNGEPADASYAPECPHLLCLSLLLACHYDPTDIVATMAMASANVLRQAPEFEQMGDREREFLAAIHIYLAHIFIFDECVPLRYWHEWAFSRYCTFGCLNRTLGKLLRLMNYRPTCDPGIVLHNTAYLRGLEPEARAADLKGRW